MDRAWDALLVLESRRLIPTDLILVNFTNPSYSNLNRTYALHSGGMKYMDAVTELSSKLQTREFVIRNIETLTPTGKQIIRSVVDVEKKKAVVDKKESPEPPMIRAYALNLSQSSMRIAIILSLGLFLKRS